MPDIATTEALMVYMINLFSERFPQSAILKGGMGLRLLDCPRMTNDLDYIFVPYKSKKDVVGNIRTVLDSVDGLNYTYSLNLKCLRIKISFGDLRTQIEINVAEQCPATSLSSASLARKNGMLARTILVVRYDNAMANKLAAWNERRLVRDLYDLYFYFAIAGVMPNLEVLKQRLKRVASTPRNKNPRNMTMQQLIEKLRSAVSALSPVDMLEIADYLPTSELAGLDIKLRAQLTHLCARLESATKDATPGSTGFRS
jgi:predicted nucleotidyltransferase component of viral defense system